MDMRESSMGEEMSDNLELDRRVLRQLMYTGMLSVGKSELLKKVNDMFSYGVQMGAEEMLLQFINSREQRQMFGNMFSTADSHMYMRVIGPFVALLPAYLSGRLDLALFNDPENVKQLYDYTEEILEYLNGQLYVEIPVGEQRSFTCTTSIATIPEGPTCDSPTVTFNQNGIIYGNRYFLNLEDDATTHILIHEGRFGTSNRGRLIDIRVQGSYLIFNYDSGYHSGSLDKHFLYRRLREVLAIESWLHMVETGEPLNLLNVKKDLSQLILIDGAVTGAILRSPSLCYCLDMKYYQ